MNQGLLNQMRLQIDMALGQLALPKPGIVSSYDAAHYAVKVRMQPEDVETGWLPLASPWIGNGWGMYCPPSIGDQIAVHFYEGSHEAGYAEQRFYNDVDVPLSVPSGDFWLVHAAGNLIKLHADGSIEAAAPGGFKFTGDMTLTGKLTVTDTVTCQKTLTAAQSITSTGGDVADKTGSIASMRSTYDSHTHPDAQGGNTGTPSASM